MTSIDDINTMTSISDINISDINTVNIIRDIYIYDINIVTNTHDDYIVTNTDNISDVYTVTTISDISVVTSSDIISEISVATSPDIISDDYVVTSPDNISDIYAVTSPDNISDISTVTNIDNISDISTVTNIDNISDVYAVTAVTYYIINGKRYDNHFPYEWAILDLTEYYGDYSDMCGPQHCLNCEHYGSLHGVFVGYCLMCSRAFNGLRGGGFLQITSSDDLDLLPYMAGVNMNQIGCHCVDIAGINK